MKFVIVTRDYAGLGFATRLADEGQEVLLATSPSDADLRDPGRMRRYDLVGKGLVPKAELKDLWPAREFLRDACWVWDFNHTVEENETLRSEGFRVLGGGRHADQMEHDRAASLHFVGSCGLAAPPSHAFDDAGEAIRFCEKHEGTAFVLKPDDAASSDTFLPESEDPWEANFELRMHLRSTCLPGSFLLQERKSGIETNVEVWFQKGEPVFAFMTLESKKRYTGDMGELVGCAFDFAWKVPLTCRAVTESVGKLFPAYRRMQYSGFADANFIAGRDGVWFFEKCERFGYNAHPNLFWNLNLSTLGQVFWSLAEGTFRPDFAGGFGASVTMNTKERPSGGQVIQFPPRLWKDIYLFDACREGEHLLTAGYDVDGYVLIATAYGYTIPTAWEELMRRAAQIRFPYRHYRTDGASTCIPSSPVRRYEALKGLGYI